MPKRGRRRSEDNIKDFDDLEDEFLFSHSNYHPTATAATTAATTTSKATKTTKSTKGRNNTTSSSSKATAAAKRAHSQSKRGDTGNINPKRKARPSKPPSPPPPPPDPPASLVKLLQKDKSVLAYFTSLQVNLNYDVKKWKDRALEYRSQVKALLDQQLQQDEKPTDSRINNYPDKNAYENGDDVDCDVDVDVGCSNKEVPMETIDVVIQKRPTPSETQRLHSDDDDDDDNDSDKMKTDHQNDLRNKEDIKDTAHSKNKQDCAIGGDIIDRDEFSQIMQDDFDSDSSSSDENNNNNDDGRVNRTIENHFHDVSSITKQGTLFNDEHRRSQPQTHLDRDKLRMKKKKKERQEIILANLREAYRSLKKLGVWVVDVHHHKEEDTDENESLVDKHEVSHNTINIVTHDDSDSNYVMDLEQRSTEAEAAAAADELNISIERMDMSEAHLLPHLGTNHSNSNNGDDSSNSEDHTRSFIQLDGPVKRRKGRESNNTTTAAMAKTSMMKTTQKQQSVSNILLEKNRNDTLHNNPNENIGFPTLGKADGTNESGDDLKSVSNKNPRITMTRRHDMDVVKDLMRALRSLVRVPSSFEFPCNDNQTNDSGDAATPASNKAPYQPFVQSCDNVIVPCCIAYTVKDVADLINTKQTNGGEKNEKQTINQEEIITEDIFSQRNDSQEESVRDNSLTLHHPAVEGLYLACRALSIMDTYCTRLFADDDEGWESLFDCSNDDGIAMGSDNVTKGNDDDGWDNDTSLSTNKELEAMRIGLRNRNISSIVISSLDGEIARYWATADRAIRGTTTVLVHENEDDNCAGDEGINEKMMKMIDEFSDSGDTSEVDIDNYKVFEQNCNSESSMTCDVVKQVYSFSSKSQMRLFLLAERVLHARLISFLYQYRSDMQEIARLVIDYIISTSPSPAIENYPRFPPIMSMCVLEAMLARVDPSGFETSPNDTIGHSSEVPKCFVSNTSRESWFTLFLKRMSQECKCEVHKDKSELSVLGKAIALNIHTAANIWKERLNSNDARIRDISTVELAAYERLLVSEVRWLQKVNHSAEMKFDDQYVDAKAIVEKIMTHLIPSASTVSDCEEQIHFQKKSYSLDSLFPCKVLLAEWCLSTQLSMILIGDIELNMRFCSHVLSCGNATDNASHNSKSGFLSLLVSCCKSYVIIQSLKWESNCLSSIQKSCVTVDLMDDKSMTSLIDKLIEIPTRKGSFRDDESISIWQKVTTILQCCVILSDGHRTHHIMQFVFSELAVQEDTFNDERTAIVMGGGKDQQEALSNGLKVVLDIGELPTVRVINLMRRRDRLRNFLVQAQREHILTVLAVSAIEKRDLKSSTYQSVEEEDQIWGLHAYDGVGSHLEFEENMAGFLGSHTELSNFVKTHWRPNDLKAFDKYARDDDKLVNLSPSERACAVSHIGSWIGVEKSLTIEDEMCSFLGTKWYDNLLQRKEQILRKFRISGFARGHPILLENENMPPTPVCVILEDDAMLVDRFTDRLVALLDELPRDFHFCSLGYGRPKSAPMIVYSSQVGIPTCVWYLTGYILSLDGARYLLNNLPVEGPVDSWIGMKMTSNWDNVYGAKIGVGTSSKPQVNSDDFLPSKKELAKVLKFRSFAALTPLCSQKLGWASSSALIERNSWRNRDTDITYSGHK